MENAPSLGSRVLFPRLEARAYLAHAAVSPLSEPVCAAIAGTLTDYAARGVSAAIAQVELRERLRVSLGALLQVPPAHIGLVQSTSVAATIVARSIGLGPGDRVVLFDGEFPANVLPFQQAAREAGAEVVRLPLLPYHHDVAAGLAELQGALARPVRLVAVSAVQFQTGLRMPIAAMADLCHRYGAELFVDAIQALGAVPFDAKALDADFVAASGHKFLMGPEGTGFLYAHPRALQRMTRGFAGWASVVDAFRFLVAGKGHLRYDADVVEGTRFVEQGAPNALGHAGLNASVSLLLRLGVDAIFAHVTRYIDALESRVLDLGFTSLRSRDPAAQSASLCVLPPAGAPALHELAQRLASDGVVVSTPDGHLRFAPHFANSEAELAHVGDVIERALR
jgi:selenocysteine lyase/cysteine desulfurase